MFPFRVSVSLSKRGLGMAVGDGLKELSWRHQSNPGRSEVNGVEAAWPTRYCPVVVLRGRWRRRSL